jgi:hypothetical protein
MRYVSWWLWKPGVHELRPARNARTCIQNRRHVIHDQHSWGGTAVVVTVPGRAIFRRTSSIRFVGKLRSAFSGTEETE